MNHIVDDSDREMEVSLGSRKNPPKRVSSSQCGQENYFFSASAAGEAAAGVAFSASALIAGITVAIPE